MALHVAQPMCMLGMAAYWFETSFMPSFPKLIQPPYSAIVSTKPNSSQPGAVSAPGGCGAGGLGGVDLAAAVLAGVVEQPGRHERVGGEPDHRERRS